MRQKTIGMSVILVFCFSPLYQVEGAGGGSFISAITKPKADVTLSFTMPGRISSVKVKEGDAVRPGQVLVQIDNEVEKAQLEQLKAKAGETSQVDASRMQLKQKKVDLKKIQWAAERGSATSLELEHAQLDVKIAEFSLQIAQFEKQQDMKKYKEARLKLERMQIASPISGRVETVEFEEGESVKALQPVVRVVRTDPLWIDAPVPGAEAAGIKAGQAAEIEFPLREGELKRELKPANVVFVSNVIDAGSNTLRIRLEVQNKTERPAGEMVKIFFKE